MEGFWTLHSIIVTSNVQTTNRPGMYEVTLDLVYHP